MSNTQVTPMRLLMLKSATCAKSLSKILDRRRNKKNSGKERRPRGALEYNERRSQQRQGHHLPYQLLVILDRYCMYGFISLPGHFTPAHVFSRRGQVRTKVNGAAISSERCLICVRASVPAFSVQEGTARAKVCSGSRYRAAL